MTANSILPEHPGLAAYDDLTGSLKLLNCAHIAAFIVAGRPSPFRVLDGVFVKSGSFSWRRADSSYLEQVRLDWHRDPDPRRRAAADHVIDLVQDAITRSPQALRQLALFQIRKLLHGLEKPDAPPGHLRGQILALGVIDDEADLLEAAVTATHDTPDPDTVVKLITARRSKQLRQAARLADLVQPVARDHVLLAFLEGIRTDNRRVDDLIAAGARLKDDVDLEKVAACYLQAAEIAADEPQLDVALRQCAPPPPQRLRADVTGHMVTVSWQPSGATAGKITYRVRRESSPPSHVADGPETCVIDRNPPMGPAISYLVVTVRENRVQSVPAVTPRFRVLPEVEDLVVTEQRGCVVGNWRTPLRAVDVSVTRHSDGLEADGDQITVEPGRTGFRDSRVTAGTSYLYRVTCGYRDPEGDVAWSAGLAMTMLTSMWPDPVTGLQVAAGPNGETVCLEWTSPAAGRIVIILGSSAMPAEGSELTVAEVGPLGPVAWSGPAGPAGKPMHCEIPIPGVGVHYLAVVTVLDRRAVIGATRTIDALEGFQGLRARRTGDSIELAWTWPVSSAVTLAAVRWDCAGEVAEPVPTWQVSRDSYHRRGVLIPARECGYRFSLTPLSTITGSLSVGPPVTDELEPQHDLAYEIIRTRHGLRAGRVARLYIAQRPTSPLDFLLVARPGTLRPTRIGQGTLVLQVSLTSINPGSLVEHRIDLSTARPPYYLLGFLTGAAALQFRLVHPSRTQLLVER